MSEDQGFMDVLAGFIPAARDTEVSDGGYFIPKGEKHLSLMDANFEPGTNDYGPYVKVTIVWSICDPGEDQDREFFTVYFVNTTKDDKLSFGGHVVDTPGVRSFQLARVAPEELEMYFVEIEPLVPDCRFADCTHTHETDCAVRAAVEAGRIDPRRYESYLRIRESLTEGP